MKIDMWNKSGGVDVCVFINLSFIYHLEVIVYTRVGMTRRTQRWARSTPVQHG